MPGQVVEGVQHSVLARRFQHLQQGKVAQLSGAALAKSSGHHHANGGGVLHPPGLRLDASRGIAGRQALLGLALVDGLIDSLGVALPHGLHLGGLALHLGAKLFVGVGKAKRAAVGGFGAGVDLGHAALRDAAGGFELPKAVHARGIAQALHGVRVAGGRDDRSAKAVPRQAKTGGHQGSGEDGQEHGPL